jgi:hypothetical protein
MKRFAIWQHHGLPTLEEAAADHREAVPGCPKYFGLPGTQLAVFSGKQNLLIADFSDVPPVRFINFCRIHTVCF